MGGSHTSTSPSAIRRSRRLQREGGATDDPDDPATCYLLHRNTRGGASARRQESLL